MNTVHSGSLNSGHYVSFVCPKADGEWFKFNDQIVTKCLATDAIEENYGDGSRSVSAYILVYIKNSCITNILRDVSVDDIDGRELIDVEMAKEIEELANKHKSYEIYVFTPDRLRENTDLKRGQYLFNPNHALQLCIEKESTLSVLYDLLVAQLDVNEDHTLGIWLLNMKKKSIRSCDAQLHLNKPLQKLLNKDYGHFYVEMIPLAQLTQFETSRHVLVFIKEYVSNEQPLTFYKHQYFMLTDTLADLRAYIKNELVTSIESTQKIAIFTENGCDEANDYSCREWHRGESLSKIAKKFNDTYSAMVVFEIVDRGHASTYGQLFDAKNPPKTTKSPADDEIANGIHVVVKDTTDIQYVDCKFHPTDSLLTVVQKLKGIMVSVSVNICLIKSECLLIHLSILYRIGRTVQLNKFSYRISIVCIMTLL